MGKKPTWTDEELISALPKCNSFSEVATYMKDRKSTR